MKKKKLLIIGIIIAVGIILLLVLAKNFLAGQKVRWTTPTGQERELQIPKIPGAKLISESKGDCSYKASYLHTLYKEKDLTRYIIQATKEALVEQGFRVVKEVQQEGKPTLELAKEIDKGETTLTLETAYDPNSGTTISLEFQWPPCSQ